jgi:hypothetical protein
MYDEEDNEIYEMVSEILNLPSEQYTPKKLKTKMTQLFDTVKIVDLKGRSFDFTGCFQLEMDGDKVICKAVPKK